MQQQLLCRSLNTGIEQPVLWRRELMPGYVIGLRPVSLHNDTDLQIIHRWLANGYTAHLSHSQLRVLFQTMAKCTYAQAFMVLQNEDKRIGHLEIYHVLQDELKDTYPAREGDYRLNVAVMPVNMLRPELAVQVLRYCISYFFSCGEVERIVWAVPAADKERNKLAIKAGLHLLTMIRDRFIDVTRLLNLYYAGRASNSGFRM
jgi:hypothetical protein